MATSAWRAYRPLDAVSVAGAYVDADGNVMAANAAFLDAWRAAAGDQFASGNPLVRLFASEDRGQLARALAHPPVLEQSVRCAARLAGSQVLTLAELAPIKRRTQEGIVWLVTLRPCHAPQFPAGREPASPAGAFVDPRTPLAVVLGWTSLLQHGGGGPARVEHALGVIERNAAREMHVIEDLLEVMRPGCTARPARRQPVDLVELVKSVVDEAQPLAAGRRVHLSLRSGSEELVTTGNDVQLRCAVTNLVVNAVRAVPPGGAVGCGLWRAARWVGLVIGETGEGTGTHEGGQGLGVTVARQVAEMHGGALTSTTPRIGRGVTFTILLPRLGLPGRPARDGWVAGGTAPSRRPLSAGPAR
jgi:hypothetical protein